MVEKKLKWFGENGLHARPAGQIVGKSIGFESSITFINCSNNREADAKGIFSLMTVEIQQNTEFIIKIKGYDENEAMKGLLQLMVDHDYIEAIPELGIKKRPLFDPEIAKNTILPNYITTSEHYKRFMRENHNMKF